MYPYHIMTRDIHRDMNRDPAGSKDRLRGWAARAKKAISAALTAWTAAVSKKRYGRAVGVIHAESDPQYLFPR